MLLRTAVLTLLLANGAYYAWSTGALAPLGLKPAVEGEPERLAQQIRPEALRLAAPPSPVSAAVEEPAAMCLQAGVFDAAQAEALRQALADWPAGSWVLEDAALPGRWIVYMGRFQNAEAVEKKRAELRALRVRAEPPGNALEPGLSLGGHASAEAAEQALAQLARQGVRTARVLQARPAAAGSRLRLPAVDAALRGRLQNLSAALAGLPLTPC